MNSKSTADIPSPAILVVDPDHFGFNAIKVILAGCGYIVHSAPDSIAAAESIRNSRFSAVLIKLRFFDVAVTSAYSVLARAWPDLPLFILGPRICGREKGHLLDAGIADYIEFPFDRDELIARIGSSIRRFRRARFEQVLRHEDF